MYENLCYKKSHFQNTTDTMFKPKSKMRTQGTLQNTYFEKVQRTGLNLFHTRSTNYCNTKCDVLELSSTQVVHRTGTFREIYCKLRGEIAIRRVSCDEATTAGRKTLLRVLAYCNSRGASYHTEPNPMMATVHQKGTLAYNSMFSLARHILQGTRVPNCLFWSYRLCARGTQRACTAPNTASNTTRTALLRRLYYTSESSRIKYRDRGIWCGPRVVPAL